MTITAPPPDETRAAPPPEPIPADDGPAEAKALLLTALAGGLATMAAAWVLSGVFSGWAPRGLALLAAAIGPAAVALSGRSSRPAFVQSAGIGVGFGLAAVSGLVARTGTAGLPDLVGQALRSGGLAQAPVPFDPGWRVLLIAIVTLMGTASAGLAVSMRKPRIAVAVAAPVVGVATLVQPREAEVLSAVVGLAFLVAALGVASAVDLVREGASAGGFELRRAGRGFGLLAAVIALLLAASQIGGLLPAPRDDVVVPPQRPQPSPPLSDRQLFAVSSARSLPWRLGTLDVYDGTAWLTPPYDPGRFEKLSGAGAVPAPAAKTTSDRVEARFQISELAGRALPALANPLRITGDSSLEVDPRTQVVRVPPGRSNAGRTYSVIAAAPPTGVQLAEAPAPGPDLDPFLDVPPPPAEVAALLESLPDGTLFDRLQVAREAYYSAVVAAGAGDPRDVTPARVGQMLAGQEATPFEITAGEAILARWVGVPSRLGYGWFGGEDRKGETVSVRPKNGATWLEVWFEGYGWVPIVGKPPRAKSSISKGAKDDDPSVRPTDRLTVFTYVPVRLQSLRQVAEVVRYWAVRVVPLGLLLALVLTGEPAARKWRRRRRRARAAAEGGPPDRIDAAYAEVRDLMTDLGGARPSATPLDAVRTVEPDVEHSELAWLVTRGLWGDLRRDLTAGDADAAEDLALSVRQRLARAQTLGGRLAAAVSRSSLRQPWGQAESESPSSWPRLVAGKRAVALIVLAVVVVVAAALLTTTRGSTDRDPAARPSQASMKPLPDPLVPAAIGDVQIRREPAAEKAFLSAGRTSLVSAGRVYSLTVGDSVEASLQAVVLADDLARRRDEAVDEVLRTLGGGGFRPVRFGRSRGYALDLPEQRLLLWFSPDRRAYQLVVARASFDRADSIFSQLLAQQQGYDLDGADVPVPDPRRGID